jgi:hypothetical protein
MMLKSAVAVALFALFGFAHAETTANVATNDLVLANKGVECAGRCGTQHHHHHHARCCGCPRKGAIAKVTKLNEILLDLFFAGNPKFSNLIEIPNFEANVQTGWANGVCCYIDFNFAGFLTWFTSFGSTGFYPIFPEGENAFEVHSSGCIIVPFDLVTVGPAPAKDAMADVASVTRAYKVKVTWCPSEGCNYLVKGIEIRSYACLNIDPVPCQTPSQ